MIRIDRTGFLVIPAPIWADLPDRIQRTLQLAEKPRGAKSKEDNTQDRRRAAGAAPVRVLRGGLNGNGHGVTDGAFDLLRQPALGRLFAENQAGGSKCQHNHRRYGEDGVKGQGSPDLKGPGLVPLQPRLLQQPHDLHCGP